MMTTKTETMTATKAETIKITVLCDVCDNSDYAAKKELTSAGWEITANYAFCPVCAIG
jgi:hypothetical protein